MTIYERINCVDNAVKEICYGRGSSGKILGADAAVWCVVDSRVTLQTPG